VEAKNEYTKQFINLLYPVVFNKIEKIYTYEFENLPEKTEVLINFQKKLKHIPHWNNIQIDQATNDVLDSCEWFTDLFAAIFISNVKILTSIKPKKKNKLNVTMPKCEDFIHKVYIHVAELLYNNIDNFSYSTYGSAVFKKNKSKIQDLIIEAIEQSIRALIPYQNILQNYLNDALHINESDSESDENSDVDETEPIEPEADDSDEELPETEEEKSKADAYNELQNEEPEEEALDEPFDSPQEQDEHNDLKKPDFFQNDEETKRVTIQGAEDVRRQEITEEKRPVLFPDASDD
jgi:hypothetical protein